MPALILYRGTPTKECIDTSNNHPHILEIFDTEEEIASQYFIVVEQQLTCECGKVSSVLLSLIALHYVFNIEYCRPVQDFFHFFEDQVLKIKNKVKRSCTYTTTLAAISCH